MTENVPNNPDPYSGIKPLVRLLCYLICFGLANYLWYQSGSMKLGNAGAGDDDLGGQVFLWLFVFAFTQSIAFGVGSWFCKMTTGSD
jgi:hypothetical protein